MRTQTAKSAAQVHGREAYEALRGRAKTFAVANLPKAASATESAGQAVADFALSGSRSLAKSMRNRGKTLARGKSLLGATPLLRTAGRFALRNPALIAVTGVAIALVGYSAWRKREPANLT